MNNPSPLLTVEEIWRRYDDDEQRLSAPLSLRMLELAGIQASKLSGKRVLDLATGRGEPAIRAAHGVGPSGSVLGLDISPSMLEMARQRADREGVTNLQLRVMNAEKLEGIDDASFDVALARWGLMYFSSPVDALSEAKRALVPGGKLILAVWCEPEKVSYYTLPRRMLEKYQAIPPIDFQAPGTFRYAHLEDLRRDLETAGLELEHFEEMTVDVMEARTGQELVAWTRAFGLTRLMQGLPEPTQMKWEQDVMEAVEPMRKDGFLRLGGTTRIVVARRPGEPS